MSGMSNLPQKEKPPLHYISLLMRLRAEGLLNIRPGTVDDLLVLHDDSCPILTGTFCCDCNPVVKFQGREYSYLSEFVGGQQWQS